MQESYAVSAFLLKKFFIVNNKEMSHRSAERGREKAIKSVQKVQKGIAPLNIFKKLLFCNQSL